jgi:hypothetical protein
MLLSCYHGNKVSICVYEVLLVSCYHGNKVSICICENTYELSPRDKNEEQSTKFSFTKNNQHFRSHSDDDSIMPSTRSGKQYEPQEEARSAREHVPCIIEDSSTNANMYPLRITVQHRGRRFLVQKHVLKRGKKRDLLCSIFAAQRVLRHRRIETLQLHNIEAFEMHQRDSGRYAVLCGKHEWGTWNEHYSIGVSEGQLEQIAGELELSGLSLTC